MENEAGKLVVHNRHHEVEIFQGTFQVEAAEGFYKWKNCHKNPGHEKFISAQDFKSLGLPKVHDLRSREALRSCIDITVRLRVNCTSRERPDDNGFSEVRGTSSLRTGTGFIDRVSRPKINKYCPCVKCGGMIKKKHWRFKVRTAHHIVYNTEEAEKTLVDLFLDDESCERDGGKKTIGGVKVLWCVSDKDMCVMECVTCDEDLGKKIESARHCYEDVVRKQEGLDLSGLDLLPYCDRDRDLGLIVSHPHGQPKKITWGEWRGEDKVCRETYTIPTCPGSSGAPVFRFSYKRDGDSDFGGFYLFYPPVHSGSYDEISTQHEDQLNYGSWYF